MEQSDPEMIFPLPAVSSDSEVGDGMAAIHARSALSHK